MDPAHQNEQRLPEHSTPTTMLESWELEHRLMMIDSISSCWWVACIQIPLLAFGLELSPSVLPQL